MLSVDDITANPRNPRRSFDDEGLNQLGVSIKSDGQLQPVVVRRVDDSWQLIAGERRWRAAKRAGIQLISAIVREASDAQAFRLALVENMHRKALSHVEMVDALDELADMVQASGLRRTAAELRIDPGWLSKELSMRRDPVIFPALEEGKLTFTQANELLSAPAAARRPLLDRLYRERPTFDVLRTWVQAARAEHRRSQQHVADLAAGAASSSADEANRFEAVHAELVKLGDPRTADERNTLGQILELVQCLLAQHELEGSQNAPAMYHLGATVTDGTGRSDPTQERVSVSVSPRRRRTLARVV